MYQVYILRNPQGRLYVGFFGTIGDRLKEHNDSINGKKSGWTRSRGPWEKIYSEEYETRSEAMKREKYLKTGIGREYIQTLISQMPG